MSDCVGHDPRICEIVRDYDRVNRPTYWLHEGNGWEAVTKAQWVSAERRAGFHNTMGHDDEPATAGFGGRGIRGRIERESRASSEHTEGPQNAMIYKQEER